MLQTIKNRLNSTKAAFVVGASVAMANSASAVAIAAPDMTDATGSVTNVFGAVLGVAVLIYGFKKVKSLL
ncbi:MAG: hypothetical protein U9Q20_08220 [Campylobacterota bacterium]|nr:hypothetical protein [Campylobacterota bacterium]